MATTSTALKNGGDVLRMVIPMTLFLGIGTGGEYSREFFRIRDAKLVVGQHCADDSQDAVSVETISDDLERAKRLLNLTTTDIAKTLGVSRQTIHNWKSGGQIKIQNIAKVHSLAAAADALASANVTASPLVLNRVLAGGSTLLETIASSGDGLAAANELLSMLRGEAEQRRMIDRMLAGREQPVERAVSDYGAPSVTETG
jgi:DNA-binding XRE family transcriptional regulator